MRQRLVLEAEVAIPLCVHCHDQIDRTLLSDWEPAVFHRGALELWGKLGAEARLVLLKLFSIHIDDVWKRDPDRVRRLAKGMTL